ncbi:MAG: CvpA family protein [Saprospiraceae bacterium]|nr:CvpA family protein [Saprospiraceae bacterium]
MTIDVLFLLIAGWGFYQGYSRGIIKTVFTAFSIVFGLMVAFKFTPAATRFLETAFHSTSPMNFVGGFLLAFLLTMIIIRMAAQFLEKLLQSANINFINQAAGGILLASLYTLVFSLLVWFGAQAHIITPENTKGSLTYEQLRAFPSKMKGVYDIIKPGFQDFWHEAVRFIDHMGEKSLEETEQKPTIFDIPEEKETATQPPDSGQ